MSDGILVTIDEGLCTITLNRPDRLNAFTTDMLNRFMQRSRMPPPTKECGQFFSPGRDVGSAPVRI